LPKKGPPSGAYASGVMYGSSIRMNGNCGIGRKKNILSHYDNSFIFKYANTDTSIFAHHLQEDIHVNKNHVQWFKSIGYDMDAWISGNRLIFNHKYTKETLLSMDRKANNIIASLDNE